MKPILITSPDTCACALAPNIVVAASANVVATAADSFFNFMRDLLCDE